MPNLPLIFLTDFMMDEQVDEIAPDFEQVWEQWIDEQDVIIPADTSPVVDLSDLPW